MNKVVDCLNCLAAATTSHSGILGCVASSFRPCTSTQRAVLDDLFVRLARVGSQPSDLGSHAALKELLKAKDLYSQVPQNIATFSEDKLAIISGNTTTKNIKQFLPPSALGMVSHFATRVEKGSDEIAAEWAGERFPMPYWDPVLKRSPRKTEFLLRKLFHHGVISFRSALKADVGIFFVKKEDRPIFAWS